MKERAFRQFAALTSRSRPLFHAPLINIYFCKFYIDAASLFPERAEFVHLEYGLTL